ncbi:MAG: class III extradiol ring-cleavage dioxygenase [Reyranellaceae bacterium]
MARIGPIFVSHGSPMMAVTPTPAHEFLRGLGRSIGRPRGILCISAHWETAVPMLGGAERPETIHDFGGFPAELYRLQYPAPGAPDIAEEAIGLLAETGIAAGLDPRRGLDHGAWVPLLLMYPAADIPVAQLSLQHHRGPAWHFDLGRALAPLCEEEVLVMGSGSIVHNLRGLDFAGGEPQDWARDFEEWAHQAILRGDSQALTRYRHTAPGAAQSHPRDEHLLPLLVPFGAAGGKPGRALHRSFELGNLGMGAWGWA